MKELSSTHSSMVDRLRQNAASIFGLPAEFLGENLIAQAIRPSILCLDTMQAAQQLVHDTPNYHHSSFRVQASPI